MSINLISFITQYLTPEVIAKNLLCPRVGQVHGRKGHRRGGAGPSCRSFGRRLDAGRRSRKLFDAVKQQPPLALDNLAGLFGGLGSEGGPRQWDQYADVRARWVWSIRPSAMRPRSSRASVEARVRRCFGLLAPVVMGALGQKAAELDASGLAQLLASQKSNISGAAVGIFQMLGAPVSSARSAPAWPARRRPPPLGRSPPRPIAPLRRRPADGPSG